MANNKKIKIAFIKYAGLSAGGSEKLAQIIAANLPKDRFEVDYFACEKGVMLGPQGTALPESPERLKFLEERGVKVIRFRVGALDLRTYTHIWRDTNFWEVFKESHYDIIQTSRAGHKEYPFIKIHKTPIVDILNLLAGVDNQYNIARVLHLCKWNADRWIKKGGDASRVKIISLPIWVPDKDFGSYREELKLSGKFIFGMHQRPDDSIFSEIPLNAYQKIENSNTAFIILGGGGKYKKQAKDLGLKHSYFLPPTGDQETIYRFLNSLNVYAHGRRDGEINSQAIAEAFYFGLPCVSHPSQFNNGHIEGIADAGRVVETVEEYALELKKLMGDKDYYEMRFKAAKKRFLEKYELKGQMKNIIAIYDEVLQNPFPHKWRRIISTLHYTQNIRIWLAKCYLYLRYHWGVDLKFFFKKNV